MKKVITETEKQRIEFLKDAIQRYYDNENWRGLTTHERLLDIAAKTELLSYGIIFEPTYNCPS